MHTVCNTANRLVHIDTKIFTDIVTLNHYVIIIIIIIIIVSTASSERFLDHILRRTTFSRTHLDK